MFPTQFASGFVVAAVGLFCAFGCRSSTDEVFEETSNPPSIFLALTKAACPGTVVGGVEPNEIVCVGPEIRTITVNTDTGEKVSRGFVDEPVHRCEHTYFLGKPAIPQLVANAYYPDEFVDVRCHKPQVYENGVTLPGEMLWVEEMLSDG